MRGGETDKEELPREYLDKGHTKDDMDTGICVTETRVCGGSIREEGSVSVRSQEALLFF